MRKTWVVAWHEFVTNFKRPGFLFLTFGLPILTGGGLFLLGLFGSQFAGSIAAQFEPLSDKPVGYVDHSGLFGGPAPAGGAGASADYVRFDDEAAARQALLKKEIGSYYVISADYLVTGKVTAFGVSQGIFSTAEVRSSRIRSFILDRLLTDIPDPEIRERAKDPINLDRVTLDAEGQVGQENFLNFIVPYLFAILLIISIFTASGFLLQGVSEEKENRVIEVLLSSVSARQLMFGKIIGLGALGLVQIVVWFGASGLIGGLMVAGVALLAGLDLPISNLLLGVVYFFLGYILFGTLMAAAGSISTTFREGQQIGGIFSLGAAIPLMFASLVFANPNSIFAVTLSFFPLTAPTMMLQRLALTDVPAGEIAVSLVCLVLGIVVSVWGAGKVFRLGLLMYGKRPSIPEIARALRQA
jgi:ABC-2 type transport system permease protein